MRVLITGSNGFLGNHLLNFLSNKKIDVLGIDIENSKKKNSKTLIGDINNDKFINKVFKKKIDIIFHFAAIADINYCSNNPLDVVNENVLNTVKLLNYAKKYRIKRFIFSSSVYVNSNEGSFYKSSKIASESFIKEFSKKFNLNFTILRFGSLYGPGSDSSNGVHRIIERAINENKILYEGDPETIREFIHIEDAASACFDILDHKYKNKTILLTGNTSIKIYDLLKTIAEIMQLTKKLKFKKNKNEGHYVRTPYNYLFDEEKKLNLKLSTDIGKGIIEVIKYIKNQ
jgi:UDP-glucose 4-epimerase